MEPRPESLVSQSVESVLSIPFTQRNYTVTIFVFFVELVDLLVIPF